MKKIFLFAMIPVLSGLVSCKKFLAENPKSAQPVDAYYQTIDQVQSAVNYLYNVATGPGSFFNVGGLYDGTNSFMLDNLSGMSNNVVAQNPSVRYFASLSQTADNEDNYVGGIWASFYSNIASANTIISQVAASTTIDQTAAAPLVATARFYRAMDYYYLVRLFGAVPLILQPYQNLDNLYAPRTSVDSVYTAIVADLQWAYTNGALVDKPMGANGNQVSKGTVGGVLALQQAQAVLASSGGYALFDNSAGTTPFDKLRLTTYDQGNEYLYFIEYNSAIQQSAYPEYSFPNTFPLSIPNSNLQVAYTLVTQAWTPSTALLSLYDSVNDIRRHEKQFYSTSFDYITTGGIYSLFVYALSVVRQYGVVQHGRIG
jgi:hypothetical protein